MTYRELYVEFIKQQVGKPYLWGAEGDTGFDCSGLVWAGLTHAGTVFPRDTAQGIYNRYKKYTVLRQNALPGTLLFYGDSLNKIAHVMTVIDRWKNGNTILVGACHGGSKTTDIEQATIQGAYVCTTLGNYWNQKYLTAVDPFLEIDK